MIYDYVLTPGCSDSTLLYGTRKRKEWRILQITAILRTNRQIYNEASHFLYSNSLIKVFEEDIVYMLFAHGHWFSNLWRRNHVDTICYPWRFHLGYSSSLTEGYIEPEVFARFEKIFFKIAHYESPDTIFIDKGNNRVVLPQLGLYFCILMEVEAFATILKNSSVIRELTILLGLPNLEVYKIDYDLDKQDERVDQGGQNKEDAERYVLEIIEIIWESSWFEPVRKLSNIKKLKFQLDFMDGDGRYHYGDKMINLVKPENETESD